MPNLLLTMYPYVYRPEVNVPAQLSLPNFNLLAVMGKPRPFRYVEAFSLRVPALSASGSTGLRG